MIILLCPELAMRSLKFHPDQKSKDDIDLIFFRSIINGGGGGLPGEIQDEWLGGRGVSPTRSWFFISHPPVFKSPDVKMGLFCFLGHRPGRYWLVLVLRCFIHNSARPDKKCFLLNFHHSIARYNCTYLIQPFSILFVLQIKLQSIVYIQILSKLYSFYFRVERSTGCALGTARDKILPDRQHRTAFVIYTFKMNVLSNLLGAASGGFFRAARNLVQCCKRENLWVKSL